MLLYLNPILSIYKEFDNFTKFQVHSAIQFYSYLQAMHRHMHLHMLKHYTLGPTY